MALPPLITPKDRKWLFKVIEEISLQPARDLCLLGYFLGTAMTTLEINRLQLKDVLHKSGKLNKKFSVRSTNCEERDAYLTNKLLCNLTCNYLDYRVKKKIGLGDNPDQYLGLDPDEPLFYTNQGRGFSVSVRKTDSGSPSYSCVALNTHLRMLMQKGGIENPSVLSGRRTFAMTLKNKGVDIFVIHKFLGNKSIETTKSMLSRDPIDMGKIAAGVLS